MPNAPRQHAATPHPARAWTYLTAVGLPAAVRRPLRWRQAQGVAVLLVAVVIILGVRSRVLPGPGPLWVAPPIYLGLLCLGAAWLAAHATLRRAAAHDHLLCPDCTYDLRALDAAGTCPECGRAYEHEAVRRQWLDAARRLKRK